MANVKQPSELLRLGSPLHAEVLKSVRARYESSYKKMGTRYAAWKEAEELYRAYVPTKTEDNLRKAKRDAGDPQYVTLHIPYSYAVALTVHTYLTSVFLSRSPVFQYTGRHGESQQQVQAVEAIVDYQVQVGQMLGVLYNWVLDSLKYGVGIVGNYWEVESRLISRYLTTRPTFLGVPIPGTKEKTELGTTRIPGYVGNKLYNVRPQDFFPDPRVSLMNFQDGEFCGRVTQASFNSIVGRAGAEGYFNLDVMKKAEKSRLGEFGGDREMGSPQLEMPEPPGTEWLPKDKGCFHILEETIRISAKDWGLSDVDEAEPWVFTVANGSVVIGAKPQGCYHGQFPFSLQMYEFDPYAFNARGIMEVTKEINMAMDFMLNQHFYNVRKSLNDQMVVDPSRIEMKDLQDGGPGKLVRLKPTAYGTDVRTVVSQLPVVDVTAQNIRDLQVLESIIQRITGATDNVMGMLASGGRKTATEVRTSTSFGINRLKVLAEYNAALGWAPLSQMLLQNSQQWYDEPMKVRIAGDLMEGAQKFLEATPELIAGAFDFVPVDGTLPIDRYAQANLWREILFGLVKAPQIGMQYDLAGIFGWMAQIAGLKNITQFKLKVTPDQMLMQQAAAGQMAPVGGPQQQPSVQPKMPDLSMGQTM